MKVRKFLRQMVGGWLTSRTWYTSKYPMGTDTYAVVQFEINFSVGNRNWIKFTDDVLWLASKYYTYCLFCWALRKASRTVFAP